MTQKNPKKQKKKKQQKTNILQDKLSEKLDDQSIMKESRKAQTGVCWKFVKIYSV